MVVIFSQFAICCLTEQPRVGRKLKVEPNINNLVLLLVILKSSKEMRLHMKKIILEVERQDKYTGVKHKVKVAFVPNESD